jgi:hypothetical protein
MTTMPMTSVPMTTVPISTMSTRVRPAGLTERLAAAIGIRALRWARRRAAERERDAVVATERHARSIERREHAWARLESRPGR